MEIVGLTFLGAFILGLAHTLEPCEDKVVVSLYAIWASKRVRDGVALVALYGLGMALVDTVLGFVFSLAGVTILQNLKEPFEIVAGIITALFGFIMFTGKPLIHVIHHHNGEKTGEGSGLGKVAALALGLIRGLPPCPVELAMWLWAASIGDVLRGTALVFIFGLGTTVGLLPLAYIMGGLATAARKTRYGVWVPKVSGFAMIVLGITLAAAPFLGLEV